MRTAPPPGSEVAEAFRAAMADYSQVLQGQAALVADLCETVTANWLSGNAGLLSTLDDLREVLPQVPPEALLSRIDSALTEIEARLTAQMAEVQRQDAVRQMLASLSEMAAGLNQLNLTELTASVEAAAAPRDILARIAESFVTQDQRAVLEAVLSPGKQAQCGNPEIELF